jgi:hypothetical protein
MKRAIDFNDQLLLATKEVDDVGPNLNLAIEPVTSKQSIAKPNPEKHLRTRHVLAHVFRMAALAIDLHDDMTDVRADSVARCREFFLGTHPLPLTGTPPSRSAPREKLLLHRSARRNGGVRRSREGVFQLTRFLSALVLHVFFNHLLQLFAADGFVGDGGFGDDVIDDLGFKDWAAQLNKG